MDLTSENPSEGGPDRNVWLHIYHCDPYTAFLNRRFLKSWDAPIYHAGVQVFEDEWSFQYFEDAWNDPSISGVIRCQPKCMTDFDYQDSICLGPTPLSEDEVDQLLTTLHSEWPACTYHLTRRNCLSFAEQLVGKLRTPKSYPDNLTWVDRASKRNPRTSGIIDYGWEWAKWWMLRKHGSPSPPTTIAERRLTPVPSELLDRRPDRQAGFWEWTCGQCTGALCSPAQQRHGSTAEDNISVSVPTIATVDRVAEQPTPSCSSTAESSMQTQAGGATKGA